MNFNEFVNEVKDNIKRFLPEEYENAEVSVMDYQKLNTTYKGLMVKKKTKRSHRPSIWISSIKPIRISRE